MRGPLTLTQGQIEQIAASDMTRREIREKYGEDIAIAAGRFRDPDAEPEWIAETFASALSHAELLELYPELR